jgi:hypothetical protein
MKIIFLTATAALFIVAPCVQGQTQRERTVLNVFGRTNLDVDPYDNLNFWTDGFAFYRPFFFDFVSNFEARPLANGDTIFLAGGTTHEGGYRIAIRLAADGKMTIPDDDYSFNKGDRVEYRKIGSETLLIFSDVRTGNAKSVLKKFDGNLTEKYEDVFRQYLLAGSYKRNNGNGDPVVFNRNQSVVSGFPAKGENAYTFVKEFGDSPVEILIFNDKEIYKATKTLSGLELIPMKPDPGNEDDWKLYKDAINLTEDNAKAKTVLIKTAEVQTGLPAGTFPLVSTQVMTLTELARYAGREIYSNASYLKHLQIMRNEIFARYGHKFIAGGEMAKHFGAQAWYKPQFDDVTSKLTEIERINIALIQILEKKK